MTGMTITPDATTSSWGASTLEMGGFAGKFAAGLTAVRVATDSLPIGIWQQQNKGLVKPCTIQFCQPVDFDASGRCRSGAD